MFEEYQKIKKVEIDSNLCDVYYNPKTKRAIVSHENNGLTIFDCYSDIENPENSESYKNHFDKRICGGVTVSDFFKQLLTAYITLPQVIKKADTTPTVAKKVRKQSANPLKVETTSEKLFKKLQEMELAPITKPISHRPGYWQRSAGAYSWTCENENKLTICSTWSMKRCLNSKDIGVHEHNLDIELTIEDDYSGR